MERYVFVCEECHEFVEGTLPHARCGRCGRVHALFMGKVTATSKQVHPLGVGGTALSPWMLPWERPTRPGLYEVRYAQGVCQMTWPGEWPGVVQSWRGAWK